MTKDVIIKKLAANHGDFVALLSGLNESDFTLSVNGKWSAAQQLKHIYLSVSPLTMALTLPRFFLRLIFGKANRPSKSYDALVEKYHAKLKKGGAASGRFIPKQTRFDERGSISNKLQETVEKLCERVRKYPESKLDEYILPHPLLGKLTIREMLYFTMYHVDHHKELVLQSLVK